MNYSHFIFTRFNVKNMFNNNNRDKYNQESLTEDWLEYRFELFNNYCLPSIINQTITYFKWVIFFDVDTNEYFLKKINLLESEYPFIKPIFVKDASLMLSTFQNNIDNLIDEPIEYLITTTLDNDDCLKNNAIATIQDQFRGQAFEFINFQYGYSYDLIKNVLIEKSQLSNGIGTSLIEKYHTNHNRTIWCGQHGHLSEFGKIVNITNDNYWLQIIHEKNNSQDLLINAKKMYNPKYSIDSTNMFGIGLLPISFTYYIIFTIYYYYYKISKYIKRSF